MRDAIQNEKLLRSKTFSREEGLVPTAACSERNSTEQSVALRDELLAPVTATLNKKVTAVLISKQRFCPENSKRLEKYYAGEEEETGDAA